MKRMLTFLAAGLTLAACGPGKSVPETAETNSKYLILYYSQTGTTEQVANELAARLNADTERLEVEAPYDGTYDETIERCLREREQGVLPELKSLRTDLSGYDTIFLGYPIWFGTYAPPIAALVRDSVLRDKVIVPFCTFGSGGLYSSMADLAEALPGSTIREGYGVRQARIGKASTEVERFLIEKGYAPGRIEPLPEYSQQVPVTEAERAIFDAACGDYKYPLGTPQTVGRRTTPTGTDYVFSVTTERDGATQQSTIYVTVENTEGAKPEFTQVVR